MGMLAVGFRIIPPWIGRFMALLVAAQVTLTAGLWGAHSPDGMVGRAALLPIMPTGKAEKTTNYTSVPSGAPAKRYLSTEPSLAPPEPTSSLIKA